MGSIRRATGISLDIAIAGAGPAGLATALYLKRAGHRVTVFDRFDEPKPVGSGLILQPTGLTVLADLGLLDDILVLGSRIDRLHGADAKTGRTVLGVRYDAPRGRRFGLAVHRSALFGVLFRAAKREAITMETSIEIETLETGERAILVCQNGRRLGPFDLVVDASGSRSKLRRHLRNPGEVLPLAYGAFWASLGWRGDGFDEKALLQRYDRASVMVGVLPIGRPESGAEKMAAFFWSRSRTRAGDRSECMEGEGGRAVARMPGIHRADRQFRPTFAGALRPSHDEAAGRPAVGCYRRRGAFDQPATRARGEHGAARCGGAQLLACAGRHRRRSAGGLCLGAAMARAGVPGAVADADAVLQVGFDRNAVRPRQAGGDGAENSAGAAVSRRDGGRNRDRSVHADRACGSAVAGAFRWIIVERCEPFACRKAWRRRG